MDSSLRSTNLTADDLSTSLQEHHEVVESAEGEHHVHLPNPSLWPFILSIALVVTLSGVLFFPSNPWLTIVAAPFVLVGILGWALEDTMAPQQEEYIAIASAPGFASRYAIGQEVVDKDGTWLGTVQARFDRYILAERGSLFVKALYVPLTVIEDEVKNNTVRLTASEQDLLARGLDRVPNDLYFDVPESSRPALTGVPMFARGPLSPAETGHYNYGPNYPGINTDASGSYPRDEVVPTPQRYVSPRRARVYATDRPLPPRATNPE
jgi:hypothetical protein